MYYLPNCSFLVTLVYLTFNASPFYFFDYEDPLIAQQYSKFNCFKQKSCTPGPPRVCGYDARTAELAEFEDKCTYHRINCEGGFFKLVDMSACDSKKTFAAMMNSSQFQWQHLNRSLLPGVQPTTTEAAPWARVLPGLVQLVLNKLF